MPFQYPNTIAEFQQAIVNSGDKKAFVQVSAAWCNPCQMIKGDLAQMAEDFDANYVFIYCDVDKMEEIQEVFEVTSMPTFMVFKGAGAPLAKKEGSDVAKIRAFLEEHKA